MTEIKELRISYRDLAHVVIPCSQCGLEIAIDITKLTVTPDFRSQSYPLPDVPEYEIR